MKKVIFSNELEYLVDENGKKYEGKRFKTIRAWVTGHSTENSAEQKVQCKVENLATQYKADAYELISGSTLSSTNQEFDFGPYAATGTAILYKSG